MSQWKRMLYRNIGLKQDVIRIKEAHAEEDGERMIRLFRLIPERSLPDIIRELAKEEEKLADAVFLLYNRKEGAIAWHAYHKEGRGYMLEVEFSPVFPYMAAIVMREMLEAADPSERERLMPLYHTVKKTRQLDCLYTGGDPGRIMVESMEAVLFSDKKDSATS